MGAYFYSRNVSFLYPGREQGLRQQIHSQLSSMRMDCGSLAAMRVMWYLFSLNDDHCQQINFSLHFISPMCYQMWSRHPSRSPGNSSQFSIN
jgi:hypothetical protein